MGRHYTPRCGSRSTRFCESGAGAERRRSRPARRRDRTACRRQRRVPLRLAATSTLGSFWALLCPGLGPGSLHWGGGGAYGLLDVSIYTKKVENRRSHACGRLRAHDAHGCAAAAAPRRLDARPRRHHAHTVQSADSGCRLYRSSGQRLRVAVQNAAAGRCAFAVKIGAVPLRRLLCKGGGRGGAGRPASDVLVVVPAACTAARRCRSRNGTTYWVVAIWARAPPPLTQQPAYALPHRVSWARRCVSDTRLGQADGNHLLACGRRTAIII